MAKYVTSKPKLPDKPGENWVSRAGGLPPEIDAVARALRAKGYSTSRAIATAVNHVKSVCATGRAFGGRTEVSAEARAKACKAAARWEAMKASTSIPVEARQAIELAERRYPTVLPSREVSEATLRHAVKGASGRGLTVELSRVELASHRPGLVAVKVQVTNRQGTTFQRTMWVRPNQAKSMRAGKGPATVSTQGREVQRRERAVLEEIAKIPRDRRPAGWDRLVRAVARGPAHGGRLGPEKRRLLRDLQANAPDGSPLKAAVTGLLKEDAKPRPRRRLERRAKRTAEKRESKRLGRSPVMYSGPSSPRKNTVPS